MPKKQYEKNIIDLSKNFSINFHKFLKTLKITFSSKHILDQIYRSSSSIAANVIEAQSSKTKKDFAYKYSLALKEAKETEYWTLLIQVEYPTKEEILNQFKNDLNEIISILHATVRKLRKNEK